MNAPCVMLVDNGSTRAAATLSLRRIAADLGAACGLAVHPVSLQHADKVPAADLGGEPAQVFAGFVARQLAAGVRNFVCLPLFFGRSRALTSFIPQQVERLAAAHGGLELRQAEPLVPPGGEPRLAAILSAQVHHGIATLGCAPDAVVVVDHGSPLPEVTAVRRAAAEDLRGLLGAQIRLDEAVMERRAGAAYDFNGLLLEDWIDRFVATAGAASSKCLMLAMMFISPGRHAGPGGDIEQICAAAMARHAGLQVGISPLVGEHPLLIDILADRLAAVT